MFPLELSLKPSTLITVVVGLLGLVIGAGVWVTNSPVWFCGSLSMLAFMETWRQVVEHGLRESAKSVTAIRWLDVFEWRVEFKDMSPYACNDMRVEFMSPHIITLSVPGRWNIRKKIWIAKDSVGDANFRRLTAGLKLLDEARRSG